MIAGHTSSETPSGKGHLIVFSAPSGAGKTTLLEHLRFCIPDLVYSISATTRSPRRGERNGVHYFFMSENEFRRKIDEEGFAEWQMVHGNYYGTPRAFIDKTLARGASIIMDIDVFGKTKFDKVYPDAVGILILPPDMEILEQRLRERESETESAIQRRMTNARIELNYALCEGKYEHRLVNDDLDRAKEEILQLVRNIIGSTE
jgi:guanylate kinase